MGPGVGIGTSSNRGPRVEASESEGAGIGRAADRALADLALALRRLDLRSFTREALRSAREGLGVEHCKVLRCVGDGDLSPLRAGSAQARANGVGFSVVVRANGRVFGILSAYSTSRRGYAEEEARFLQNVAELLGVAAERALVEETHRRAVEKERRRADAAEEKYLFLQEANAVLTAAPDGLAAASAARLAVPALADSCFVDLVEEDGTSGGRIRRLFVVCPDGAVRSLAREFTLCYPLDPSASHGTSKVLRTGQPELFPEAPDGLLRSLAGDGEHLESMQSLAPGSYLCVPLQAGSRLIGSIGFVSSRTGRGGRRHGPEDLTLARCLARCTALVVASSQGRSLDPRRARASGKGSVRLWDAVLDREPVLTPRQLEVLRLLDRGMRVRQIKVELNLSEPTVRTHVRSILRAFGARSQLEALHRARVLGFVGGRP